MTSHCRILEQSCFFSTENQSPWHCSLHIIRKYKKMFCFILRISQWQPSLKNHCIGKLTYQYASFRIEGMEHYRCHFKNYLQQKWVKFWSPIDSLVLYLVRATSRASLAHLPSTIAVCSVLFAWGVQ